MQPKVVNTSSNVIWSILNQFSAQIIVLIVFLVNARFISKADFGAMAIAMLVVEVLRQLTIESIATTLMAKPNPDHQDYNAGFAIISVVSVISAVLVYFLAEPISLLMGNDTVSYALKWVCLIILTFGAARVHEVWLIKNMMFKQLAIRSILTIMIGGAVGIYLAVHGYGIKSLIAQQVTTTALSVIFLWVATKWHPSFNTTMEKIKEIFNYGRIISFNNVVSLLSSQIDVFFAGFYLGVTQTGVYSSAKRIILAIMMIVSSSINSVSLPSIVAANKHGDVESLKISYLKFVKFSAFFTVPLLVGLATLSLPFVTLLLGAKWADTAPVITIACSYSIIATLENYNANIFLAKSKPKILTYITISHLVLSIILISIFVRYGINWLAIALLIKGIIIFPFSLRLALKMTGTTVKEYFSVIGAQLFSAAIMGAIIKFIQMAGFLPNSAILELLVLILIGMMVYLLSMSIFNKLLLLEIYNMGIKLFKHS